MNFPVTRKEAIACGSVFYLTGKPCKKGHVMKRRASTGQCSGCAKELTAAWKLKNSQHIREYDRARNLSTREYQRERQKVYRGNNPGKRKDEARSRRENHRDKLSAEDAKYYAANSSCIKDRMGVYHKNNPHVAAAASAKRRALVITEGLSPEDRQAISAIYKLCRLVSASTGIAHEVDHIIPLSKGGRHEPNNLQIITAALNRKKGAKLSFTITKKD